MPEKGHFSYTYTLPHIQKHLEYMNELITVIIIGVYTLIYVIVFIMQRNQIQKQSQIISSMESFMNIFDVEEVRKFVDMKHETTMLTVDKVINQKGMEFSEENVKPLVMAEIDKVKGDMSERFDEFANSAVEIILLVPKELRVKYIHDNFPLNKQVLLDVLIEIDNSNLTSNQDESKGKV